MSSSSQFGGGQSKKGQPDMSGNARKTAMTVIGPVKKNKMGFYKESPQEELPDEQLQHPMDMAMAQASHAQGMYPPQAVYGLMGTAPQPGPYRSASASAQQQYSGPRPMGYANPGPPQSPGRGGGLLYLNGGPQRAPAPAQMLSSNAPPFAPAARSLSSGAPQPAAAANPPLAPPQRATSQPFPAQRMPFSPQDPAQRLPEAVDEPDPFPALGAMRPPPVSNLFPATARTSRPKESDFSMLTQDDFPALPGSMKNGKSPDMEGGLPKSDGSLGDSPMDASAKPEDDVCEGYGLLAMLPIIRQTDPQATIFSLGVELGDLGLNLNSPEPLFASFHPWAERPPALPASMAAVFKGQLSPSAARLVQLPDDALFYAFYCMPGDMLQFSAAQALYIREWRFLKDQRIWITRSGTEPHQKAANFERGVYTYFDTSAWKKLTKELTVYYENLERQPLQPAP